MTAFKFLLSCGMTNPQDIRWEQRFANYKKALVKLGEVAESGDIDELSELEREGLIQRFEYTYELASKTLQDFLKDKGYLDVNGPNTVLTQSFQDGYIVDGDGWRRMKKSRELTSHTYDSDTAEEIAEAIFTSYFDLLKELETRLEKDRSGNQLSIF